MHRIRYAVGQGALREGDPEELERLREVRVHPDALPFITETGLAWLSQAGFLVRNPSLDSPEAPDVRTYDALIQGRFYVAPREYGEDLGEATFFLEDLLQVAKRWRDQGRTPQSRRLSSSLERQAWVQEHGSEHLRRTVAGGYNALRLYLEERAAKEHPGYVPDFDHVTNASRIATPSGAGLFEAERVGGEVVWLSVPPWQETGFRPCEAVVIRRYLGKVSLFKPVDTLPVTVTVSLGPNALATLAKHFSLPKAMVGGKVYWVMKNALLDVLAQNGVTAPEE